MKSKFMCAHNEKLYTYTLTRPDGLHFMIPCMRKRQNSHSEQDKPPAW